MAASTSFNGQAVFDDASRRQLVLQGGIGGTDSLSFSLGDQLARTTGDGTFTTMGENAAFGNFSWFSPFRLLHNALLSVEVLRWWLSLA